MEALSVPFSNRSSTPAYDGVIIVRGVVATEPQGLVLEYTWTENYWNVKPTVEHGIRTVTIPWSEVQSLTYRPWWVIWGSLVLQTRTLRALEGVPLAKGNEITLPVARRDRWTARDLAATVEMALADRRLAALEASSAPPALPPS